MSRYCRSTWGWPHVIPAHIPRGTLIDPPPGGYVDDGRRGGETLPPDRTTHADLARRLAPADMSARAPSDPPCHAA